MERYNADQAARVWQRVRGEGETALSGLQGMAAAEQSMAEALRQLQRQNMRLGTEELAAECSANAVALRGILRLMGQRAEAAPASPASRELPENTLRRCYAGALQLRSSYEKYADHPEYGPVFRELFQRKGKHCFRIAEVLGKQPGVKVNR